MTGGPMEIGLIIFAILVLFGYKKLPDASRSLGRSLRIFKGEMRGMKEDDRPEGTTQTRGRNILQPPRAEIGTRPTGAGMTEQSQPDARMAELRAAQARDGADQAESPDGDR
ncbi:MAG: Sec-independent protein translocase subunit TatA [Blastococcus sp.]